MDDGEDDDGFVPGNVEDSDEVDAEMADFIDDADVGQEDDEEDLRAALEVDAKLGTFDDLDDDTGLGAKERRRGLLDEDDDDDDDDPLGGLTKY